MSSNVKIYTKKEFNDYQATRNTDEEVCAKNLGSFSLSNAQMLVKNYVSNIYVQSSNARRMHQQ